MDFRPLIILFLSVFFLQGGVECRGRSSGRGLSRGGSHRSSGGKGGFWSSIFGGGGSSSKATSSSSHTSSSKTIHSSSPGHTSVSSPGSYPKAVAAPPYGFKSVYSSSHTSGPVGSSSSYVVRPPAYTPHNSGIPPPAYNPAHNSAGYGAPPAYHQIYGTSSHASYHYDPQVISTVNSVYPKYHYSSRDTGRDDLGFYLGYSLGRLNNPTYHYHSHYGYFDGYSPRYDHYQVHHYYHNKDQVPSTSVIEPDTVIKCPGDSDSVCPMETYSLCTNNGVILCVTEETVPCVNQTQQNCAKTRVPCVTNECNGYKTIIVPCVSTANVTGLISVANKNMIITPTTTTTTTTTEVPYYLTSQHSLKDIGINIDDYPESLQAAFRQLEMSMNRPNRRRRSNYDSYVNTLCVVALAVPAERNSTNQEEIVKKTKKKKQTFLKILSRVHGLAEPTSTTLRTTSSTEAFDTTDHVVENTNLIEEEPIIFEDGRDSSRSEEKPVAGTNSR